MLFMRSDEEIMKYIKKEPTKNEQEAAAFIEMVNAQISENLAINWSISLKDDPKMIGSICIWKINKDHHRAELGYSLHTAHHKKGIMDECVKAVLNYGFYNLTLNSIEAHIDPENKASIALVEKNGFRKEGYHKENFLFRGQFFDTVVYAKTASEHSKS
jgi:ribosomal-protein-alanine N-acetyltransferase